MRLDRVTVRAGAASYPVFVAEGGLAEVGLAMRETGFRGQRAVIVTVQPVVDCGYHEPLQEGLAQARIRSSPIVVPDGEPSKSPAQLVRLWEAAAELGLDRSDAVVALGGGVVGDLAGFLAASYLRGVPFVQVPTSLLAQVDSSVGGKVGINLDQGKNLVGAFHQPRLVWADVTTLRTLPDPELASGLAEVVKHAVLDGETYFGLLERQADAIWHREAAALREVVLGSVRIKGSVVAVDEREERFGESGAAGRMALNLGHTLGHAIEAVAGYGVVSHGQAVAVGLVFAGRLALAQGLWSQAEQARLEQHLERFHLPTRIPRLPAGALVRAMHQDKKRRGERLTWILPVRLGQVTASTAVDDTQLRGLLVEMGATEQGL